MERLFVDVYDIDNKCLNKNFNVHTIVFDTIKIDNRILFCIPDYNGFFQLVDCSHCKLVTDRL